MLFAIGLLAELNRSLTNSTTMNTSSTEDHGITNFGIRSQQTFNPWLRSTFQEKQLLFMTRKHVKALAKKVSTANLIATLQNAHGLTVPRVAYSKETRLKMIVEVRVAKMFFITHHTLYSAALQVPCWFKILYADFTSA